MTTSVVTRRQWATVITTANASAQGLKVSPDAGTDRLRLISRTGFEQRHIVTSQIGSL
jgi:hypothetical protein